MVFFPLISGSKLHIKISYQTSQTASAAQWLTPEQTAGKNHPYFFTQCQVSGTPLKNKLPSLLFRMVGFTLSYLASESKSNYQYISYLCVNIVVTTTLLNKYIIIFNINIWLYYKLCSLIKDQILWGYWLLFYSFYAIIINNFYFLSGHSCS